MTHRYFVSYWHVGPAGGGGGFGFGSSVVSLTAPVNDYDAIAEIGRALERKDGMTSIVILNVVPLPIGGVA